MNTVLDHANGARADETGDVFWTRDYLLHHCEGYIVDGPDGPIGVVSEVVEIGDSLELVVEGTGGELRIPLEAIRHLDSAAERIAIAPVPR